VRGRVSACGVEQGEIATARSVLRVAIIVATSGFLRESLLRFAPGAKRILGINV
jgi:hypothetical protein